MAKPKADFFIGLSPPEDESHLLSHSGPPFFFSLSDPNEGNGVHFRVESPVGSPSEESKIYGSPPGTRAQYCLGFHEPCNGTHVYSPMGSYSGELTDPGEVPPHLGRSGSPFEPHGGFGEGSPKRPKHLDLQNGFRQEPELKQSRSHNSLQTYFGDGGAVQPEDYNGNLTSSLARSLSAPRRCSFCNKMVLFKAYRCKQCRHRCHKKCSGSGHSSRRNSAHKTLAGEEHWSKVLQANEVNSNLLMTPCQHGHNKHVIQHVCCQKAARRLSRSKSLKHDASGGKDSKDTNIFTTLYNRFIQWVGNNRGDGASTPASGSGRTTPSDFRSRSGSMNNYVGATGGADIMPNGDWSTLYDAMSPADIQRWCHTGGSWGSPGEVGATDTGSELGSMYASSACSSLTMLSTSTATSECPSPTSPGSPGPLTSDFQHHFLTVPSPCMRAAAAAGQPISPNSHRPLQRTSRPFTISSSGAFSRGGGVQKDQQEGRMVMEAMKRRHSNLTSTVSCPTKDPLLPPGAVAGPGALAGPHGPAGGGKPGEGEDQRAALCATWPPCGRNNYTSLETPKSQDCDDLIEADEEESLTLEDSVFSDERSFHKFADASLRQNLGECSIDYQDLRFEEVIRVGRNHTISKGRWHGEVMIHTYSNLDDEKISAFWQEVSKLSMIRHENIALFMGACIDLPNLAVVTSVRKGASLYQQLHFDTGKINMHSRVNIARQVAQGLGYLHHKGIVAKKLNSRNIYLEPKVKLCLLDHGMPEAKRDRVGFGSLPRGQLTYIAPEMLTTLSVESPKLAAHAQYTQQTDVYAFSTLLYELMSGHFPMKGSAPECIIWRVGIGHRQCLKHIKCNSTLKTIIAKCWKQNPADRPLLIDINRQLQFNAALHKRHSSSEPDALNRIGFL